MVSQPAHAWVAGQLALAWGNSMFPSPSPRDEVVLGAILHDIGWLEWESRPTLNIESGLPHTFMELSTTAHLDIWEPASRIALPFGRYAALLVSLHGTYLYGFHNYDRDTPDEARRAHAFVTREKALQQTLFASLRADASARQLTTDDAVARNRRLLALWDRVSLAICGNATRERMFTLEAAGARGDDLSLTVTATSVGFTLHPWPLSIDALVLRVDARRMNRTFGDQDELNEWFSDSALESIEIRLAPVE